MTQEIRALARGLDPCDALHIPAGAGIMLIEAP